MKADRVGSIFLEGDVSGSDRDCDKSRYLSSDYDQFLHFCHITLVR